MSWIIEFHEDFDPEFENFPEIVKDHIYAKIQLLEEYGVQLGRPYIDTLKQSKHANMKEMRVSVDNGIWRIALAFDPQRKGILLVGGDKRGRNQKRFYRKMIKIADVRFDNHLKKKEE